MPEIIIRIGGRDFEVACQTGEESYLQSAAKMLDDEAQVLSDQIGRMPESRMLLMAGLMLADKTASVEDRIREVEAQLAEREAELAELQGRSVEPERVEVAVVPPAVTDALSDVAMRAELLVNLLERKTAG